MERELNARELLLNKIKPSLTGTYLNWMGYKPDEEGVTYLPSNIFDSVLSKIDNDIPEVSDNNVVAKSMYPIESYQMGMTPDQQVFINKSNQKRFNVPDRYLRGHELYHSNFLTPFIDNTGNKGYMPVNVPEKTSLSGIENFLTYYPQIQRPQERGASLAGLNRLRSKF